MHSLLVTHYLNGAWYPKGGASEIAYHMIPIIEKAGGAVLVRAPVNRILFNDAKEAYGECDSCVFFLFKDYQNTQLPQRRDSLCFLFVCFDGFRCECHERSRGNPHPCPHGHLQCWNLQHLPKAAAQRAPVYARLGISAALLQSFFFSLQLITTCFIDNPIF